jgi:hypothetical protein
MPARNVQEPECSAGGLATAPSKARPQSGATLQTTVAIAGRSSLRQLVGLVGALHESPDLGGAQPAHGSAGLGRAPLLA